MEVIAKPDKTKITYGPKKVDAIELAWTVDFSDFFDDDGGQSDDEDNLKYEIAESVYSALFEDCDFSKSERNLILDSLATMVTNEGLDLKNLFLTNTNDQRTNQKFFSTLSNVFFNTGDVGKDLFAGILSRGMPVFVNFSNTGEPGYDPIHHTLYLNTSTINYMSAEKYSDALINDPVSTYASVVLGHELGHIATGIDDFLQNDLSDEWANVTYVENPIREALGYGDMLRQDYGGISLKDIENGFSKGGYHSSKNWIDKMKNGYENFRSKCK